MKIPEILMIETVHQPGSLARVLQAIADAGLTIDHLQSIRREQGKRGRFPFPAPLMGKGKRPLFQAAADIVMRSFLIAAASIWRMRSADTP